VFDPTCNFICWSIELGAGWAATGMKTNLFTPSSLVVKSADQSKEEITGHSFLFVDYASRSRLAFRTAAPVTSSLWMAARIRR
jgi:hypothetical protein